ncbi:MAG: aldo/keto reductase [Planctomycetota bacterium]|jgi:aryl-alcohol dehydrogenase-like predicted oxidoreductase
MSDERARGALDRRGFLGGLVAAGAGLALGAGCAAGGRQDGATQATPPGAAPPCSTDEVPAGAALPRRRLGRTGEVLPVLGLGGYHLGMAADERAARELVEAALAEGVRFFDTAESYQSGRSERWLGASLADVRGEVFLMTKTHAPETRSAQSARDHLHASLERLRTDRLDLFQLHSVKSVEDVDRAFADGGAMEAIFEARDAGLVRFTGVTGHLDPAAHLRALEHWDAGARFDTMQMPINPMDAHQASFQLQVLPGLVERDIGVLAMKTSASGALLRENICTVEECLAYVLGLPVSVAIVGMETPEQVREDAAIVRERGPLDAAGRAALLERIAPRADLRLESYKAGR